MPLKAIWSIQIEMSGELYPVPYALPSRQGQYHHRGGDSGPAGMKVPSVIAVVCSPPKDHHTLTDI